MCQVTTTVEPLTPQVLAAMLLVLLTACAASQPGTGRTVAFSLPDDDGNLVRVPASSAKATVVDAFASDCEPCKRSIPALVARKADLESRGGKLVLLAALREGESTDDVRKVLDSWGVRERLLVDKAGTLKGATGVPTVPATFVIGQDGEVRWAAPPGASAEDVVAHVP